MLKNKFLLLIGAVLILATSCKDDALAPIATFDSSEKGAYPALVEDTDRDINLNDIASSSYVYSLEFIDLEKGALVSEYSVQISYFNNATKETQGPVEFKSFASSSFETNADGNKGISNITINASEALAAFGLSTIGPGDVFRFTGRVTTTSGQSFTQDNSSATVTGAAFRGHFNFSLTAICPSSIGGTYNAVATGQSTDGCCPAPLTAEKVITLTDNGKGNYTISDWSGGLYFAWYEVYGITVDWPMSAEFIDVCDELTLPILSEPFGESAEGEGTVDPATGIITYTFTNSYADEGTVVLTPQ